MEEEQKNDTGELLGEGQPAETAPTPAPEPTATTDVAPVAPASVPVAAMAAPAPGTEQIEGDDVTFPRYRLLQKTSSEVEEGISPAGVIKNSITEETFQECEIIPLSMMKTRVMFDPDYRRGAPICRSNDSKHGSGCDCGCNNFCSKCEYKKWADGVPPICAITYNYPVIRPDQVGNEAIPTLLSFMKSSTETALKLNTSVQGTIPPIPFWHFVWKVSAESKKFKKGSAFVFSLKKVRETTDEERQWSANVYQACIAGRKVNVEVDDE